MKANGIISMTTDFSIHDPYAGIMKGIIYGINRDAHIVDITHSIPAQDIVNAAFTLARSVHSFPPGTVHIAVIDPGVGGDRKNIVIRTDKYYFVGPDNGLFSLVVPKVKDLEAREIVNKPFVLNKVSHTFHGRDVYAPCAARLSRGENITRVGPMIDEIKRIDLPEPKQEGSNIIGEVISVDSFGNLITNIPRDMIDKLAGNKDVDVYFASERFKSLRKMYSEVKEGEPLALIGSSGYLEVSMNGGSAVEYFMTAPGSTITVRKR